MKQLAFYFDSQYCSGCKTCQVACKDKNDLGPGILWRRVYEIGGGTWKKEGKAWVPDIFAYNLSLSCNHCDDPICLRVCPTGAIEKREDGIVRIDQKKCMGCRYCEWACPYGSPRFDEEKGLMGKCDMCCDYIDQGKMPVCVSSCPMRALDFGRYEDLLEKYGDQENIYPLPDPEITRPRLIVHPHPAHGQGTNRNPHIINREEVGIG
ncbi:MAG TPA: dimethylsulfoxide reductase subunit B [Bacteroidetes bacterium]|nr:dimethylsulfoxide reductase subunit B [Bacteroidota bacterium]